MNRTIDGQLTCNKQDTLQQLGQDKMVRIQFSNCISLEMFIRHASFKLYCYNKSKKYIWCDIYIIYLCAFEEKVSWTSFPIHYSLLHPYNVVTIYLQ